MPTDLLEVFDGLDDRTRNVLADIRNALRLSLATLHLAEENASARDLSAEQLSECLLAAGVSKSARSIANSFAKAGDRVSRSPGPDRRTLYRLMTRGRREAEAALSIEKLEVLKIEAGKPRSARLALKEVLCNLRGVVRICDPYYGERSLDSLEEIPRSTSVRFLTGQTSERAKKLKRAFREFRREHRRVEVRVARTPRELHDRYVVTSEQILILGHGLKDIGGRESFVIRLDKQLVPDLIREVMTAFDSRWQDASPI